MATTRLDLIGESIPDVVALEDLLSEPTPGVVEALAACEGDLIVLGVSGKMGPTLARMARRAFDEAGLSQRKVYGVARFGNSDLPERLQVQGIEPIRADLLEPGALERLPEAPNVVFMAAMKFGSSGQQARTWAMNCLLPGLAARRYRNSRIVAFSTGNIYGLVPVDSGGSTEQDAPRPDGEYAMSCLGRERLFEFGSREAGTPVALIRLNYAVEMRYGVLVDIAQRVLAREPIDLSMGHLNAIWQGDANAMTLRAFAHVSSPPTVLNLTGPEILRVREVAEAFAAQFGVPVTFRGQEAPDALLNNARRALDLFGPPRVGPDRLIPWIADWLRRGGPTLDKPTRFEVRDGVF